MEHDNEICNTERVAELRCLVEEYEKQVRDIEFQIGFSHDWAEFDSTHFLETSKNLQYAHSRIVKFFMLEKVDKSK